MSYYGATGTSSSQRPTQLNCLFRSQLAFSQRRNIWLFSPLALWPQNVTTVVSPVSALLCLAPSRVRSCYSLHASHAGCFMVSGALELRGQQRIRVLLAGILNTVNWVRSAQDPSFPSVAPSSSVTFYTLGVLWVQLSTLLTDCKVWPKSSLGSINVRKQVFLHQKMITFQ